jgi:hypothetical protein
MSCENLHTRYKASAAKASSSGSDYDKKVAQQDFTAWQHCAGKGEREAAAEQAAYSQIYETSAKQASQQMNLQTPDYTKYLSQNRYGVPQGPGAVSQAVSGLGQGILIFGILGGGLLFLVLMYTMIKPKTSQFPGL